MASECSWEQQVEVPVCGPKKEGLGGVLLVSPLLCRAVLGQGRGEGQTSLCLPRGQRQRTAREVDFNSESYCQLAFTGGYYVPGDFPYISTVYCSQPAQWAMVQVETEN